MPLYCKYTADSAESASEMTTRKPCYHREHPAMPL